MGVSHSHRRIQCTANKEVSINAQKPSCKTVTRQDTQCKHGILTNYFFAAASHWQKGKLNKYRNKGYHPHN
jgi:hypothetical protein